MENSTMELSTVHIPQGNKLGICFLKCVSRTHCGDQTIRSSGKSVGAPLSCPEVGLLLETTDTQVRGERSQNEKKQKAEEDYK